LITNVLALVINGTNLFAVTGSSGIWKYSLSELTTPVELTYLTASENNGYINLEWVSATELNNLGFDIQRSENKSDWTKIAYVKGSNNSTKPMIYNYSDKSVNAAGKYYYRLKQIDYGGSFIFSKVIEVTLVNPADFIMYQNFPNPFNPNTTISYSLPIASDVMLMVYNTLGQTIKVLEKGYKKEGNYFVNFNTTDLPSGIYFYKLEAGQFSQVKKMILIK
jgi:hypothetical protein